MVEIVKLAESKECTCYTCKAQLRYNYADIVSKDVPDYRGDCSIVYSIKCPACQANIGVSRW